MGKFTDEFTVEFKMDLLVTGQDIEDIMCTALDGGITHWCSSVEVIESACIGYASEQLRYDGKLKLFDAESDDTWVLTRDMLLNGIKLWAEFGGDPCGAICGNGTLDTSEIDANIADMIVQYALFGEVVFG